MQLSVHNVTKVTVQTSQYDEFASTDFNLFDEKGNMLMNVRVFSRYYDASPASVEFLPTNDRRENIA